MTDKAPDAISDPRPCEHGLVVDLCGCCIRDSRIADLQSLLEAEQARCEELEAQVVGRDNQIAFLCEENRRIEGTRGFCCCGECDVDPMEKAAARQGE